jgi:hypothetical protein
MTLARRLAAVESALTPTQLVVRWLDEAHAFGGLEAFVRSQLAEESFAPPLDQLARAAANGARAGLKGKPHEEVGKAVDTATRETVFRFELVLRINVISHELIERELLLDAVFSAQLALLTTESRAARRRDPTYLERFAQLRGLILLRLSELRAAQEARLAVEERYLAGHPALFPDDVTAWAAQLRSTETLAGLALGLAEHDGLPPAAMPDPDSEAARVSTLIADLVEPAKVTALEQLGDGQRALGIATSWVRGKLGAQPADN